MSRIITSDEYQQALDGVIKFGSLRKAAKALQIPRTTLQHRYHEALRLSIPSTTDKLAAPVVTGDQLVVVIPDAHAEPAEDLSRFAVMGRFIADVQPDFVVDIGDFIETFSLCSHVKNESLEGRKKPTIQQDLECHWMAREAIMEPALNAGLHMKWHSCAGNHDWTRMVRFEEQNPETAGLIVEQYLQQLDHFGWSFTEFGEYFMLSGCGFVHIPLNIMGRPQGGKQATVSAARESTFDQAFGHTHRFSVTTTPKMGGESVKAIEVGCALPYGYVKDYAKHLMTGWDWGMVVIKIIDGRFRDVHFVSMKEIEARYGQV